MAQRPAKSVDQMIELRLKGTAFSIKRSRFDRFLRSHADLYTAPAYDVQSQVPVEVLQEFVESRNQRTKVTVTAANAASFLLLAQEFGYERLASECSILLPPVVSLEERLSTLEERVWTLEHGIVCALSRADLAPLTTQVSDLKGRVSALESGLGLRPVSTDPELSDLPGSVRALRDEIARLKAPRPASETDSGGMTAAIREALSVLHVMESMMKLNSSNQ
jgi:hypothetical protein